MSAIIGALRADLSASFAQLRSDLGKSANIVANFGSKVRAESKKLNKTGQQMSRNLI